MFLLYNEGGRGTRHLFVLWDLLSTIAHSAVGGGSGIYLSEVLNSLGKVSGSLLRRWEGGGACDQGIHFLVSFLWCLLPCLGWVLKRPLIFQRRSSGILSSFSLCSLFLLVVLVVEKASPWLLHYLLWYLSLLPTAVPLYIKLPRVIPIMSTVYPIRSWLIQ